MVTFVLAGVLGSVLAVGETTPQAPAPTAGRASAPYDRLFAAPSGSSADVGQSGLIRFARKPAQDLVPDTADRGPCKPVEPADQKSLDPGIFLPPRDPQIDFKIRRIVPTGCIDPGIFIPKRKK